MNILNTDGKTMKTGTNSFSNIDSKYLKNKTNNKFEMIRDCYENDEVDKQKNCSRGIFFDNIYLQNQLQNSGIDKETSSTKINRDVDSDYVASTEGLGKVVIRYLPFEVIGENGAIDSKSSTGGSTSYAKDFDPENPVMVVRGKDDKGYYEAFVEIKKINPRDCSAIELEALKCYFIGETDAPFLPANFGNQGQSPYDSNDSTMRFDLVEAYKTAKSMNMFSSQGIAYNINDALDFFKALWGDKFS